MQARSREVTLGILEAEDSRQRTLVVHCHDADGSHLELRQQSWGGEALGWCTNASINLDVGQLGQLRAMLANAGTSRTRPARPERRDGFTPRIVQVESA